MVNLLRKLFIKNYEKVDDEKVRSSHGLLAAFGGIFINLILFGIKLAAGLITFSMSIISDAINNLTDMFSCIVNLIGFKLSSKPADKEHPFGHQRIEYITGMIISFIIVTIAIILAYTSIQKLVIQEKNVTINIVSMIILGISIILKITLGLYYRKIGKIINSIALKASMQDSFNDAICTSLVLVSSIFQYFFGTTLWFLDGTLSLLISFFVMFTGIKMIKETASPLVGVKPDPELVKNIVRYITKNKQILGIHDLVIHNYGPSKIFISIHCEVDGYGNVMELHDLIDNIENEIRKTFNVEITIHMDPIDTKNPLLPSLKKDIQKMLSNFGENLSFHDLRVVTGPTHTNVLFDVLKPVTCKKCDEEIEAYIKKEIKQINKTYNAVIKIDINYID